jgi:hypothetical protein
MLFGIYLDIPDMLITLRVFISLTNNLVSAKLRPYFGPAEPVYYTKEQDSDANNGKHDPRVAFGVSVAIRRDKRYEREEDIGEEIDDRDGQVSVPRRFPSLALIEVQVNETGGDEAVDPGTGIGIEIRDEIVSRTSRWCQKHNHGDEPADCARQRCFQKHCGRRDLPR